MKMEINEKKENVILKRTEVRFTIDHKGESTPSKGAVVDELAKKLDAKRDAIVLNNIDTVYGSGLSKGYAKVYVTDYNDFNEEELKVITSKNEDLNKKINAFLGKNKLV